MSDTDFNIFIAGTTVKILSLYDCVHEFCTDYITDKNADLTVKITPADIDFERERDDKSTGSGQGRIPADYPDSYLEVLACYRKIAEEMLDRDILLMHGSAVSIDGTGVMFIAESGTGKSTHAGIWQNYFKDRVKLINDDKPLVRITEDQIYICGTPWSGKKGLNTPIDVPLKTIYKVERYLGPGMKPDGQPVINIGNNYVFDMDHDEKWAIMASQSYKSSNPLKLARSIALADKIMQAVPVKRLVCDMSDDAAKAAYEGVCGGSIS